MWKSLVIHPLVCIAHAPCIVWEYTAEAGDGEVGVGLAWVACGSISCQRAVVKKHICLSSSPALGLCVRLRASSSTLLNFSFPIYRIKGSQRSPSSNTTVLHAVGEEVLGIGQLGWSQ